MEGERERVREVWHEQVWHSQLTVVLICIKVDKRFHLWRVDSPERPIISFRGPLPQSLCVGSGLNPVCLNEAVILKSINDKCSMSIYVYERHYHTTGNEKWLFVEGMKTVVWLITNDLPYSLLFQQHSAKNYYCYCAIISRSYFIFFYFHNKKWFYNYLIWQYFLID